MFGVALNYDTRIFIGGQELSGIESAAFQYAQSRQTTRLLGMKSGIDVLSGPPQASFNVSRYLLYDDPLYDHTGSNPTSGSFHHNGLLYGFDGAYLTEYSVNCAVGAVPIVNANYQIYGDFLTSVDASGSTAHPTIDIPTQGSITLTTDHNTSTNRVVGFDFSCSVKRVPHYRFGQQEISAADAVDSPLPITFNAQVQIEVDDVDIKPIFYYSNHVIETVSLSVVGRNGNTIGTYTVPNAQIVGEQLVQSANGALILQMNYIGYTNDE